MLAVLGCFEQGLGRKLGRMLESQRLASFPESLIKRSLLGHGWDSLRCQEMEV